MVNSRAGMDSKSSLSGPKGCVLLTSLLDCFWEASQQGLGLLGQRPRQDEDRKESPALVGGENGVWRPPLGDLGIMWAVSSLCVQHCGH